MRPEVSTELWHQASVNIQDPEWGGIIGLQWFTSRRAETPSITLDTRELYDKRTVITNQNLAEKKGLWDLQKIYIISCQGSIYEIILICDT